MRRRRWNESKSRIFWILFARFKLLTFNRLEHDGERKVGALLQTVDELVRIAPDLQMKPDKKSSSNVSRFLVLLSSDDLLRRTFVLEILYLTHSKSKAQQEPKPFTTASKTGLNSRRASTVRYHNHSSQISRSIWRAQTLSENSRWGSDPWKGPS